MTEPKIRFKRFDGEWINYSFQDFICPAGEKNRDNLDYESYSITNESGFVPQNEKFVNGGTMKNANKKMYYIVQPNTFAYNPARINVGSIGFQNLNYPVIVSSLYVLFKTTDACNDQFLSNWFKTSLFSKQVLMAQEGGVRLYFFYDKLKNSSINLPSFKEQQVIADFFQSLDSMINLTSKKIEKLKHTLTGCMQTMFPQEGELEPKVRFKGFDGEWKSIPLKEIAKKKTDKNVGVKYDITLTNSAEYGVINQRDFFDHDISNSNNIGGYYIIDNDDFVYNPRISVTAPVGPINRNQLGYTGIMSPLYLIFNVDGINIDYLSCFFKTTLWHNYMKLNGNSGARFDRLAISDDAFFNMPIAVPQDSKEQLRIANYFKSLNEIISLQTKRLDLLKHIKSACLDNMFV